MFSIACKLQQNYICATGLLPFILRFFMTGSIPCLLISMNGLLFHIFYPYINIQVWNAYVFMLTCFGTWCFRVNVPTKGYEIVESLIHVTCVQGIGFICMVLSGF